VPAAHGRVTSLGPAVVLALRRGPREGHDSRGARHRDWGRGLWLRGQHLDIVRSLDLWRRLDHGRRSRGHQSSLLRWHARQTVHGAADGVPGCFRADDELGVAGVAPVRAAERENLHLFIIGPTMAVAEGGSAYLSWLRLGQAGEQAARSGRQLVRAKKLRRQRVRSCEAAGPLARSWLLVLTSAQLGGARVGVMSNGAAH